MRMPWGKHKDTPIYMLEDSYLWWLYGKDVNDFMLSKAIEQEAHRRWPEKFIRKVVVQQSPQNDSGILDDVKSIYRKLALKFHPDHGGNTQAMQALNEFKTLLTETK